MPIEKIFGTDSFTYVFTVDREESGQRLDAFTKYHLGRRISREYIKRKIKCYDIKIQGRNTILKAASKVVAGEKVSITIYKSEHLHELDYEHWEEEGIAVQTVPAVVYEDENIIVISKPPFMSTYPTGRHSFNCATAYFENIYQRTIHSIHRLDRETSGILILGKNACASRLIAEEFAKGRMKKCYFLLAKRLDPELTTNSFPISANERIDRSDQFSSRICMRTLPASSDQGQSAHTVFHLLHIEDNFLAALAFPSTGRQHQIRVHAAAHGFPLLGDKLYGPQGPDLFIRYKDHLSTSQDYMDLQIPRHALHALSITLPEELDKIGLKSKTFICDIPSDLANWVDNHLSIGTSNLNEIIQHKLTEVLASGR